MADPSPAVALDPSLVATHAAAEHDRTFFGHPRGLSTLFFTEMWERFSYYGMRALLLLYMTAPLAAGGLGFDAARARRDLRALHVDGLHDQPAGRVDCGSADRAAPRRALRRHPDRLLAISAWRFPTLTTFYLGLFLIVIGTGLLKGNVSVIVGQLYTPADTRRDAGFSIFYMGINLGAFIAPLVCGYLGQRVDWHVGFAAAGFGMVFGLVQYTLGAKYLGKAGLEPAPAASPAAAAALKQRALLWGGLIVAALVVAAVAIYAGILPVTASQIADAAGYFLLIICVGVLRLAVHRQRMDARGAQAAVRDRRPVPGVGALLGGIRTGWIHAEPVCGPEHA